MIQFAKTERSEHRKTESKRISEIVSEAIHSDETKWEYVTGGTDRTSLHIPIDEIVVSNVYGYRKKGRPDTSTALTDDYYYCFHKFYQNDTGHWVVYYDIYRYERFVRGIDGEKI